MADQLIQSPPPRGLTLEQEAKIDTVIKNPKTPEEWRIVLSTPSPFKQEFDAMRQKGAALELQIEVMLARQAYISNNAEKEKDQLIIEMGQQEQAKTQAKVVQATEEMGQDPERIKNQEQEEAKRKEKEAEKQKATAAERSEKIVQSLKEDVAIYDAMTQAMIAKQKELKTLLAKCDSVLSKADPVIVAFLSKNKNQDIEAEYAKGNTKKADKMADEEAKEMLKIFLMSEALAAKQQGLPPPKYSKREIKKLLKSFKEVNKAQYHQQTAKNELVPLTLAIDKAKSKARENKEKIDAERNSQKSRNQQLTLKPPPPK